mmetsp:Transcript_10960/g.36618  ORF Transcript_10960/g.36618 Transcript_10960/m.36618 type:complete len:347 (-) Transcript_10960:606-1646(-)
MAPRTASRRRFVGAKRLGTRSTASPSAGHASSAEAILASSAGAESPTSRRQGTASAPASAMPWVMDPKKRSAKFRGIKSARPSCSTSKMRKTGRHMARLKTTSPSSTVPGSIAAVAVRVSLTTSTLSLRSMKTAVCASTLTRSRRSPSDFSAAKYSSRWTSAMDLRVKPTGMAPGKECFLPEVSDRAKTARALFFTSSDAGWAGDGRESTRSMGFTMATTFASASASDLSSAASPRSTHCRAASATSSTSSSYVTRCSAHAGTATPGAADGSVHAPRASACSVVSVSMGYVRCITSVASTLQDPMVVETRCLKRCAVHRRLKRSAGAPPWSEVARDSSPAHCIRRS